MNKILISDFLVVKGLRSSFQSFLPSPFPHTYIKLPSFYFFLSLLLSSIIQPSLNIVNNYWSIPACTHIEQLIHTPFVTGLGKLQDDNNNRLVGRSVGRSTSGQHLVNGDGGHRRTTPKLPSPARSRSFASVRHLLDTVVITTIARCRGIGKEKPFHDDRQSQRKLDFPATG